MTVTFDRDKHSRAASSPINVGQVKLPTRRRGNSARATLLAGTSAVALLMLFSAGEPAQALCIGRCGAGGAASAATAAATSAMASAQQAAQLAQQSMNALARATQAVQAMQAVQSAARNAALAAPSSVPNGLAPGGLVPDSGLAGQGVANRVSTWVGANTPTQSTSGSQTVVTINQTAPQALLNWQTFNVGAQTIVNFNQQGNTNWVALNKIAPNGVPSQILGSIRADGSVYIINGNGIIFGGTSQINVHTLIASSLDLNDSYATSPSQSRFLTGQGIVTTDNTDKTPSFQSIASGGSAYSAGPVVVNAGAQIAATGGQVLLLAPSVRNDGAISTPSGQTLLVGGSDVILTTGDSYTRGFVVLPNQNYTNPNVPGGFFTSSTPGTVTNNGSVTAQQGNITIIGGAVTQNGVLSATTSTTANGSILIRAETGNLLLGGAADNLLYPLYGVAAQPSLLQIIPDAADTAQITDTQAVANSSISLSGINVDIRGIVQLHGYDVTNANDHPGGISIMATGTNLTATAGAGPIATGQVFLEDGSLLDASGTTDAVASASRNSVAVELRTNELRDSPLVKAGLLYQQTIYVDATASGTNADGTPWYGTPLADASGWIGLLTRSLDERLMNGAPITIGGATFIQTGNTVQAPANLVQAAGSIINLSGGYLTYTSGFVRVSTLVGADGRLESGSNADPNIPYAGICCSFTVNHPHWGVTETFNSPLISSGYFQSGYIQGGGGGRLTLAVSSAILDGDIEASVVSGIKQRTATTAPAAASFMLNGTNPGNNPAAAPSNPDFNVTFYNADAITLSDSAAATAAGWASGFSVATDLGSLLAANSVPSNSVYVPVSWLNSGFGTIALGANDTISLPAGSPISLPAGGTFTASANTVDIRSSITAPGGTIALPGAFTTVSTTATNPNGTVSARSGLLNIGAGVALGVAGLWTNDVGGAPDAPIVTKGGTITLGSYGDIDLGQGSVLDVSGGAYSTAAGKITPGSGGTLALKAGLAPVAGPSGFGATPLGYINLGGGALTAAQLKGYGAASGGNVGQGGSLLLQSSSVVTIVPADSTGALITQLPTGIDDTGNSYSPVRVSAALFSSGGFASTSITAAGITLPAGTTVTPTVSSLAVAPGAPSAMTLADSAVPVLLASGLRPAASITLHATGDLVNRGANLPVGFVVDPVYYSLVIAGTISTDPKGSVTLTGDQLAVVSGTVTAPAGSITLAGGTASFATGSTTAPLSPYTGEGVWLTGQLLAPGVQIDVPQSNGTIYADVLPGGQVTLSGGDIIAVPGSTIDVSGASGRSSLLPAGVFGQSNRSLLNPAAMGLTTPLASDAGAITVSAVLGAVLEGTLLGRSGGAGAVGGTLSLSMAAHGAQDTVDTTTTGGYWPAVENTNIILQPTLLPGDANYVSAAQLHQPGFDLSTLPEIDAKIPVSVQMIAAGGFASLSLSALPPKFSDAADNRGFSYVTFAGNTALALPGQLSISAGTIVVPNGATVSLQANYLVWSNTQSGATQPTAGSGILNITANTVDLIGDLAVQGAERTSFTVAGDFRLNGFSPSTTMPNLTGSLVVGGELDVAAQQIYPSTDTGFTLAALDQAGKPGTIVFATNGAPPPAPLSAGGVLNVYASEIDQDGTLRAPTGAINLGSGTPQTLDGVTIPATTTLELGSGSLTSVSADGQVSLFGNTQNGSAWFYNGFAVSAPPAKQISLNGGNIVVASGAILNGAGGGDLYAGEFVPGQGGSENIFAGASVRLLPKNANVYAIIPGYTGISAYDPASTSSLPSIGKQIYLNGEPGLPAGVYTLLPAQYAELPGAFLVTVQTAPSASTYAATRAPIQTVTNPDGSALVSGYFTAPGTGAVDPHWSVFRVMSDAVARKYTEIDNSYANSFFAAQAARNGAAIPRLPEDAGQLSITAMASFSFQGTGVFDHPNGLGGIADINANQILVVDNATAGGINALTPGSTAFEAATAPYAPSGDPDTWNPVVLAASDLDRLGVESLMLGGSRSFQSDGIHVTASAHAIVIANDAKDPLSLPDIQLIATPEIIHNTIVSPSDPSNTLTLAQAVVGTGQIVIAPNSVMIAAGAVSPGESSTYILSPAEVTPQVQSTNQLGPVYSVEGIEDYYTRAVKNQLAYVRLSGGGLVTTIGGTPTYAGVPGAGVNSVQVGANSNFFNLPANYATTGSISVGANARLTSDNSLTLFTSGSSTLAFGASGAKITAQAVEIKGSQISLGAVTVNPSGLVLDQTSLDGLAGVRTIELISEGTIDLYGSLSLGELGGDGQPILGSLILDSAGLVEKGSSGTASFTAEQVALQNSLGGTFTPTGGGPVGGTLVINAIDVLGADTSGEATGYNNAQIMLGGGIVTLAGFGNVDLRSTGQIVATGALQNGAQIVSSGNAGALDVQSPLTLDAPRIASGIMTTDPTTGLPKLDIATYTITAADDPANPGTYYPVNLINSSGALPALPTALLGNSLTVVAGQTTIGTTVSLPGGTFNATANGSGNGITVAPGGVIDVSGQAVQFVDVLATIGGGNITLTSMSGGIAVQPGAVLNVGDLADAGALNQTSAGTLTLNAHIGGVTVASGTLLGQGPSADSGGSFVLDTNSLDQPATGAPMTYDQLAAALDAAGFTKSWNIRARSGDIAMTGVSQARSITVSADGNLIGASATSTVAIGSSSLGTQQTFVMGARLPLAAGQVLTFNDQASAANYLIGKVASYDPVTGKLVVNVIGEGGSGAPTGWNIYAGNIDISGTIDVHGTTPGQISIWAGNSLVLESTAQLNAHSATADANGRGGQVWLGASQAGNQQGGLVLNVGATIDVGADAPNAGVSSPVFGGQVTFSTSRGANNSLVNLTVNHGSFTDVVSGISGESAWDGVVVVGNEIYASNTPTLIITPGSFQNYINDANTFMGVNGSVGGDGAAVWSQLGLNAGSNGIITTAGANAVLSSGLSSVATNQVLINIRPGIVIKNTGNVTIEGDAKNWKGIDLSGSAYATSVLNHSGNSQALDGHFGQYDEPIALALRAGGNLNFGAYTGTGVSGITLGTTNNLGNYLTLGTLSDGFSQFSDGLATTGVNGTAGRFALGAGASAWAASFDPAVAGAYNGMSGGLGADSASYFLTAGSDLSAANPLTVDPASAGTMTVAGVAPGSSVTFKGANFTFPVTTDPFFLYNYSWSGGNLSTGTGALPVDWLDTFHHITTGTTILADYASLVRTGTGNITIATAKDLVLQSPLSLIYTAGTGYNVNNSNTSGVTGALQPLQGFTQYNGTKTFVGTPAGAIDYLPPSTFPTHGGDLNLRIGGNIVGAMNSGTDSITANSSGVVDTSDDEQLPFDMTALGSQLKLENWVLSSLAPRSGLLPIGSFNALYATDMWMTNNTVTGGTFYTPNSNGTVNVFPLAPGNAAASGTYQLAWYTWFPYLENTIGSFGGGNVTAKVGGTVANIQFVAPTSARDAGPYLVASAYGYDSNLVSWSAQQASAAGIAAGLITPVTGYDGLYVLGGGNVSVTAGGDITNAYTYVQNGTTTLRAGGSARGLSLATSSGDISVQARGTIDIKDKTVTPGVGQGVSSEPTPFAVSGIALIQNTGILDDLGDFSKSGVNNLPKQFLPDTVLTGILTSAPTGSVTLSAIGSVTLGVSYYPLAASLDASSPGSSLTGGNLPTEWNTTQGILPAQLRVISLGGDITNINNGTVGGSSGAGDSFVTYPDAQGTVDLLAHGSVDLQAGFVVSDADPTTMPTLGNIAALLAPFKIVVNQGNASSATLATPNYDRLHVSIPGANRYIGGALYLASQDTGLTTTTSVDPFGNVFIGTTSHLTELEGDSFGQSLRNTATTLFDLTNPGPVLEAERHAGLHAGDPDPARIIALTGDVVQGTVDAAGNLQRPPLGLSSSSFSFLDPYENVTKATEVYAGRDIVYLALLGQNNNAGDITWIAAGRDVTYTELPPGFPPQGFTTPAAIDVGGPGNLVIQAGRNVDLGSSTGVISFGNLLDMRLPGQGASITIEAGLGAALTLPGYADFVAQFVNPATSLANPYAMPLELFDPSGAPMDLSPLAQDLLFNRIFFDLVRDSGREHTGAARSALYQLGPPAIDTTQALNYTYSNYQRAFAAIGALLGGASGSGDFLGGLSTVRTLDGGNITVMAPQGQIQVGLVAQPNNFPGYFSATDPTLALDFGIVSERGGNVDLYANGNISVNQSRVFTLEGGDLIAVSRTGNIDAGKGAKTVQAIQPPSVTYDGYGNTAVETFAAGQGSGLGVLRTSPSVPLGNADLIAFVGAVNAGDAGIRVSGNLNVAAVVVLNANNIQVGGTATGIPLVSAPNIGALTAANNTSGAVEATGALPKPSGNSGQPSIIIVEVIGYGGEDEGDSKQPNDEKSRNRSGSQSYNLNSPVQVIGSGELTTAQKQQLTEPEQKNYNAP